MTKFLLKISQSTVFTMLILFGLSNNKLVINYFLGSTVNESVYLVETEGGENKDSTGKQDNEKKDQCDYCLFHCDSNFSEPLKQKLESLLMENAGIHVFKPQSPPPEAIST